MYTVFENARGTIIVDVAYATHVGFSVLFQRQTRSEALLLAATYAKARDEKLSVAHAITRTIEAHPLKREPMKPLTPEQQREVDEVAAQLSKKGK